MRIRSIRWALTLTIGFSAAATTLPARGGTLVPLPVSAAAFSVGSIHVERFGSGPESLVLIPGLGCGAWVWAGTIERFSRDYTAYVITLPGFDGQPMTPQRPLFATFSADFWTLLSTANIHKPVVIGHSLGGTLAIALAEQHPDRLKAVVAVDGLPIFPPLAMATPTQRQTAAAKAAARYATLDPAEFLAALEHYMQSAVTDPALVEPTAELEARSDPKAVADWVQEDFTNDLRAGLKNVAIPLLEIMPYEPSPAAYTQEQTLAFYRELLAGAPRATVQPVAPSRHFIMLDQPETFYRVLANFLTTLQ
jgi:pimeloyl-ACP methyl ester carboxylesterase